MERRKTYRFRRRMALLAENADMAFRAIRSNRLRSFLTIAIIALGITSLVGILTAVDSMDAALRDAYGRMGAGVITVRSQYTVPSGKGRICNPVEISRVQAERFVEHYRSPAVVSIFSTVADNVRAVAGSRRTNPTVSVIAVDRNYLRYSMLEVEDGRDFTQEDIDAGRFYCIVGSNVAVALFGQDSPVGQALHISGRTYMVVGVAVEVGNTASGGMDDCILVPYTNAVANLVSSRPDFVIGILPEAGTAAGEAASDAEMTFRAVRRLAPSDESDFRVNRSEAVMAELDDTMGTLTAAAMVIGLITLTGAAVGLMNIMLVSVRERTKEIGTRKAMGASSRRIKAQFLMESVLIGELGGMVGTVFGLLAGNVVAAFMHSSFVIPWLWIVMALAICMGVGIFSGYIPATRAAAMDPIECLRYE